MPGLRASTTAKEAHGGLVLLAATPRMQQGGLGLTLLSGLVMAFSHWRGVSGWMVAGLVGFLLIGILIGTISGRWIKRVTREVESASDEAFSNDLRLLLTAAAPWAATSAANGMALSLLWIMTAKPAWVVSLALLIVAGAIGGWLGLAAGRRSPTVQPPRS